jgi:hypothetical protein
MEATMGQESGGVEKKVNENHKANYYYYYYYSGI